MDGMQTQPLERPQPPYQRAPSRTSSSASNARSTPLGANASAQHPGSSPRLYNAHPTHRFHHSACARPPKSPQPNARNPPQLSRESSVDSTAPLPGSSFLQERLQKERKAHSDRAAQAAARSRTNLDMSASMELPPSRHGSLGEAQESDGPRPWSSSGEPGKQKAMGLRETEQSMSDLHKKNFNLKLEVSKRRDMQIQLETRLEEAETKRAEMEDINDNLLKELEKRDAAVEEAVAHIVRLEAELEQMKEERELERRIHAEDVSPTSHDLERSATPRANAPQLSKLKQDSRVLNRMPSFLSEQTEDTETLRKVYLSINGSALTLPRLVDRPAEEDVDQANGLPSPTALSTLSESSFLSVYGQREMDKTTPPDSNETLTYNGVEGRSRTVAPGEVSRNRAIARSVSASIDTRANAPGRALTSSHVRAFADAVERHSPLQKIERDPQYAGRLETPRPQSQGVDAAGQHPAQPNRSPGRRRTKEEKREALRRVMTDAPGGVRLHDHALPPTPDTISTTTLRRFKNSNDTLAMRNESSSERSRSNDALTSENKDEDAFDPHVGVPLDLKQLTINPPPKMRDFNGNSYFEFASATSQRPRTAGESTVSYRHGNDWDSDSDIGEPDAPSIASSDIWMHESGRINRDEGRISPDFLGFSNSTSRGGWAADAMLGPSSAQIGGVSLYADSQMPEFFSMQQGAWSSGAPPPPPNRRSSLHARTGSQSAGEHSPINTAKQQSPPRRQRRRQRRNSDDAATRPNMQKPAQPQFYQPAQPLDQKKNHYPPIAGQQGARAGLNRLFRRSLSIGSGNAKPEVVIPTGADAHAQQEIRSASAMGAPSWVARSGVLDDDDRSGATPPPILRNPRHMRADSWDQGMPEPGSPDMAAPVEAPVGDSPVAGSATGTRRKWLPSFGRTGSLKNRNG